MLRTLACFLLVTAPLLFSQVTVSQESAPGVGDFTANVLGTMVAFQSTQSAAAFYSNGGGNNWNGSVLTPVPNRSHLLLASTSDGLTLIVVHDALNDPDGGAAEMRIELFGDANGATRTVEDDPQGSGNNDLYTGAPGASAFTSRHTWIACCTDGLAISGLDPGWWLTIQFTNVDGSFATPSIQGLNAWSAYSLVGAPISLALQADRRVQISGVPPTPQYQSNSVLATLAVNGVWGTAYSAATVTVPIGVPATLQLGSLNIGMAWELGLGLAPLVPVSSGALVTSDNQFFNLDLTDPAFIMMWNFFQSPGFQNVTIPFSVPNAVSLSAQMLVLDPYMASGLSLSQPVRLIVQ